MKRTRVTPDLAAFPERFRGLMEGIDVYDSSCSPEARVWFLDREGGLVLKSSPQGTLENEAKMTAYFHSKGLSAEVVDYLSSDRDWLLTTRVSGEDCTWRPYLNDPVRLCDTIAERLRMLHELTFEGCPVDHVARYMTTARKNYESGAHDDPACWGYSSVEEAWAEIERNGKYLKREVLLHGDYCLPNIMLDDWCFSGFIDVGNGGTGDRHVDLFWGAWTLNFNLRTDAYRQRFFDAYGRDLVNDDTLRTVAAFEVFG